VSHDFEHDLSCCSSRVWNLVFCGLKCHNTATITLTGDGDFECMLDDGPFIPCKLVMLFKP